MPVNLGLDRYSQGVQIAHVRFPVHVCALPCGLEFDVPFDDIPLDVPPLALLQRRRLTLGLFDSSIVCAWCRLSLQFWQGPLALPFVSNGCLLRAVF